MSARCSRSNVGWAKALLRRAHHLSYAVDTKMVGTLRFAHPTSRCLSRSRRDHLRQQRFALGLGAIALHRRGKALEDAVFERGDDGVVDIALAADRGWVRQFVRGRAHGVEHLLATAALAGRR